MTVTVVGSGNIAHALISCLRIRDNDTINVLTSQSDYAWKGIKAHIDDISKEGFINVISNDPQKIIPQSDIILFTVPAFVRKAILKKINPYIADSTLIGSFPGVGGFDEEIKEIISNKNINVFSSQRVPYIARIKEKGESVLVTLKDEIHIAVAKEQEAVKMQLEQLLGMDVILLDSFLEVSLSNSNPILHSARLYRLLLEQRIFDKAIYFYREWDDESSKILLEMDREFMKIVDALDLLHIKSLEEHYEVEGIKEMSEKIQSIDAFKDILTPMIKDNNQFKIDVKSRYFTEDIGVGLKYIQKYAKKLNIDIPMIDKVYSYLFSIMDHR